MKPSLFISLLIAWLAVTCCQLANSQVGYDPRATITNMDPKSIHLLVSKKHEYTPAQIVEHTRPEALLWSDAFRGRDIVWCQQIIEHPQHWEVVYAWERR